MTPLSFLGFLPPWVWRVFGAALIFVAVWVHGDLHGRHIEEVKYEKTLTNIRVVQDEQAVHAGRVALDRTQAIQSTVNTYEAQRRSLGDYYAGRLRDAASRNASTLPKGDVPAGTAPADAGRVPAACGDYIALEERCAVTALKLKALREAATAIQSIN